MDLEQLTRDIVHRILERQDIGFQTRKHFSKLIILTARDGMGQNSIGDSPLICSVDRQQVDPVDRRGSCQTGYSLSLRVLHLQSLSIIRQFSRNPKSYQIYLHFSKFTILHHSIQVSNQIFIFPYFIIMHYQYICIFHFSISSIFPYCIN